MQNSQRPLLRCSAVMLGRCTQPSLHEFILVPCATGTSWLLTTMAVAGLAKFFHVSVNGRLHSCVSPWDTIEEHGRMAKCIVRDAPIVLASSQIFESCVYSSAKVGTVSQIIVPYALR